MASILYYQSGDDDNTILRKMLENQALVMDGRLSYATVGGGGGGGTGDVVGPASATDHAIVRFDGATGKLVEDSSVLVGDDGVITAAGAFVKTANPMGALVVDVTKSLNTKTVAVDTTFTFSGVPASSNQFFSILVTNSDVAAHTLTIPSSFALGIGTVTTTTIPASGKLLLTWQYDGSVYNLYGASPLTTGTGSYVLATSPTITDAIFTSSLQIPNGAAPTTDAFGEIAGDNNAWGASRGAVQFFDGTANTYLVGVLASDVPSNGQVPTWNTGGTVTWETPASGTTLTSTYVGYGSGGNAVTGTAEFFYDVANTRLQVANVRIGGGNTTITTSSGDLNITSSTGDIITATGTRTILAGTAHFFPRGGLKRVGTQFDKTSSTVLSDVTGLSVSLAAATSYRFRVVLFTTSNIAAGVQAAVASSGSITSIIYEGYNTSAGSIAQTRATTSGAAVAAVTAVTAATIVIEGSITTNAAGNLTVQFAQNTSNGVASSVLVGSYMEVFGF